MAFAEYGLGSAARTVDGEARMPTAEAANAISGAARRAGVPMSGRPERESMCFE
jgi:hypothetical protein